MSIELLSTFNVYFLHIDFQKGNYRLYVNDDNENSWEYSVLPQKKIPRQYTVYDITPKNWMKIELKPYHKEEDYFLINNLEDSIADKSKKNVSFIVPVLPTTQKIEQADYNFDGYTDYRIGTVKYSTKFEYFLYNKMNNRFERDILLSSLDVTTFDLTKKTFLGYKLSRIDSVTTHTDEYIFENGNFALKRRTVQKFMGGERIDHYFYEIENGQLVFKQYTRGAE